MSRGSIRRGRGSTRASATRKHVGWGERGKERIKRSDGGLAIGRNRAKGITREAISIRIAGTGTVLNLKVVLEKLHDPSLKTGRGRSMIFQPRKSTAVRANNKFPAIEIMAENGGGPHKSTSFEFKRVVFALKPRSGARSVHHHAFTVSSLLTKNSTKAVHRRIGMHLKRKGPIRMAQTDRFCSERAFESVESIKLVRGKGQVRIDTAFRRLVLLEKRRQRSRDFRKVLNELAVVTESAQSRTKLLESCRKRHISDSGDFARIRLNAVDADKVAEERQLLASKKSLAGFDAQAMHIEAVKDQIEITNVVANVRRLGEDADIVNISEGELPFVSGHDIVNKTLPNAGSVNQTEGTAQKLVKAAIRGDKGSELARASISHRNLHESTVAVSDRNKTSAVQHIKNVIDARKHISVLDRKGIEFAIINSNARLLVRMTDQDDVARPRRHGVLDDLVAFPIVDSLTDNLAVDRRHAIRVATESRIGLGGFDLHRSAM